MPSYAYRAVDATGRRVRGRAEAEGPAELNRALDAQGMLLLDAAPVDPDASALSGFTRFRPGRRRAVLEATRAVAALLPAGLPLSRALAAAGDLVTGEVAAALEAVRRRVERGDALAAALAEHPRLFPPLYVGLVRAGERSGELAGAFSRLADQLEREDALRGRLLSASIYPMLLAGVGGIAVVVLLLLVLPRFVGLLEGTGAALPRSTAMLLALSTALHRFWPVLAIGLGAAVLFGGSYLRTEAGRRAGAGVLLRIPLIRNVRRDALAARFSRMMGVLLGGGAPLLPALEDVAESLADPLAREEAARVRARVREGAPLHQAIGEGAFFPPLLTRLVAVGEDSGQLEGFLNKAADVFEDRTERMLQRLVTLLEPAMIIGFGIIVAFVALSLLQAIYGVNADAFR